MSKSLVFSIGIILLLLAAGKFVADDRIVELRSLDRGGANLHLAVNLAGAFSEPAKAGFNLADISSPSQLQMLPHGVAGVLWLGNGFNDECSWRLDDAAVVRAVEATRDHPNFSGIYYIADEPHPGTCPDAPRRLAQRTNLIHNHDPAGITFAIVLNPARDPTEFSALRNSVDLIGVDPYPCTFANEKTGCDLPHMRERIEQAIHAGIPVDRIVPVFQVFGQSCTDRPPGYYRLPKADELKAMLSVWDELSPIGTRPFDMAYSWAPQPKSACPSLAMADGSRYGNLLSALRDYFTATRSEPAEQK
jgi:hypothetical protein